MSTTPFTWGLIGPGKIAHQFADAVHRLPGSQLGLVYGRDLAKAEAFAAHWMRDGAQPRFTADLQALLDDATVDAIYIATPHAQHGEFIAACLAADKPGARTQGVLDGGRVDTLSADLQDRASLAASRGHRPAARHPVGVLLPGKL